MSKYKYGDTLKITLTFVGQYNGTSHYKTQSKTGEFLYLPLKELDVAEHIPAPIPKFNIGDFVMRGTLKGVVICTIINDADRIQVKYMDGSFHWADSNRFRLIGDLK